MNRKLLFLPVLLVLSLGFIPSAIAPARAATVAKTDPGGGYSPCTCSCFPLPWDKTKVFCVCVCDA